MLIYPSIYYEHLKFTKGLARVVDHNSRTRHPRKFQRIFHRLASRGMGAEDPMDETITPSGDSPTPIRVQRPTARHRVSHYEKW